MDKRVRFLLLLLVLSFNLFYGLGDVPLLDPDEPVYAETAREMIEFGDFLSPRIYNEVWFDKPPMFYWLAAGSFQTAGIGEFGARLPSALFGLGTIALLYASVSRLFDEDVAFWSALVLGTSLEFFYLGKAAVTDMTLLFFLTGSTFAFLEERYLPMYAFMGLGTLTKGPIGIVFPCAVIFLHFIVSGDWQRLKRMKLLAGSIICLAIAAPWYFLMYQAHGRIFIDTFLGFHNLTRFTSPEHPDRVLWYYYLPVLIIGLFPWTGFLLNGLRKSIAESTGTDFKNLIFMNVWWVFVFLFFSVSQTKLVSYILPLFPPLAVICGWNVVRISRARYPGEGFQLAALSFSLLALFAAACFYGASALPEMAFGSTVLACIMLLLAVGIVIALVRFRDVLMAAWLHAAAGILTMIVIFNFMLPSVADRFSVKKAAAFYADSCDVAVPVHVDKFLRPGFMFYARIPGFELKPETTDFQRLFEDNLPKYVVVRGLELRRLKNVDTSRLQELFAKDDIYLFKIE